MLARIGIWIVGAVALASGAGLAAASIPSHAPWEQPGAIIVLDPYEQNALNYDRLRRDPHRIMAIIHQASKIRPNAATHVREDHCDVKFQDQARQARAHVFLFGAYHFGTDDDPVRQAKLFLRCIQGSGVHFVALDLEGMDPPSMSIAQAVKFLDYMRDNDPERRAVAIYAPRSVADAISRGYDRTSPFAKGALWIASPTLDWPSRRADGTPRPSIGTRVWQDYAIWQFTSDELCMRSRRAREEARRAAYVRTHPGATFPPIRPCPIRIDGMDDGTDVNVFNGTEAELKALFGG